MANNEEKTTATILFSFMAGMALGAGFGLLAAPKSGKEASKQIRVSAFHDV